MPLQKSVSYTLNYSQSPIQYAERLSYAFANISSPAPGKS